MSINTCQAPGNAKEIVFAGASLDDEGSSGIAGARVYAFASARAQHRVQHARRRWPVHVLTLRQTH